jgi:hypothetical protein
MSKQLLVSSQLQAVLLNDFLLDHIKNGFWKDQRPAGHSLQWEGVEVVVSDSNVVGPAGGFKPTRFYDFLNPKFTELHEDRLVQIASSVKPGIKFKALKKELIELARIIGGRMTDKTKEPARVYRGNNRSDFDVIRVVNKRKTMTTAQVKAVVAEAARTVKKTAVRRAEPADAEVTIIKTAAGATVRRVSVKAA